MLRIRLLLPFVALLIFCGDLTAQSRRPARHSRPQSSEGKEKPQIDIGLLFAIPINAFADNTDAFGFGARGGFQIPFSPKTPLYFGFNFGGAIFGSNSQYINEVIEVYAGNTKISQIPINLEVRTNNWMLNALLGVRYKVPLKYVQPYGELLAGGSYFYTRTAILDRTSNGWLSPGEGDEINAQTLSSSFTYSFGAGLGFLIRINEILGINIGAAYLKGGSAKYYDKDQTSQWRVQFSGSGTFDPGNPDPESLELENTAAEPKKSATDMIQVNVGVAITIGN